MFVGSGAAEITQPGISAYCKAKAVQELLVKQLAAETNKIISFVFRQSIVDTRMQEQAREAKGGAAKHINQEHNQHLRLSRFCRVILGQCTDKLYLLHNVWLALKEEYALFNRRT